MKVGTGIFVARFIAVVLLLLIGPSRGVAYGQSSFGSIVGLVTDPAGAVVPGATVIITDLETNDRHFAQSGPQGDYNFVNLLPATYSVAVEKSGFKRFQLRQTVVEVDATVRVNAALQVGETSETVMVTSDTPLLTTDSGTLSTVIEGKTVTEMPLNGRNIMNLLALAPGVVPGNNAAGSTVLNNGGHTQIGGWDNYQIGGGLSGQSAFYIDGQPLNVLGGNTVGYVPTQDSVQEFSVASNSVGSEYGRFAGGVVNMATKSGTNAWHGSAYEFLRNNVLNSNEFFNKQAQLFSGLPNKRTQYNQNQYGATFGGPIKSNKAFFFFSWENFAALTAANNAANVPTADMQAGYIDGANLASAVNTAKTGCGATYTTAPSGVAATYIPSTCWDPTASVIKTEYPAPLNPVPGENFNKAGSTGSNTTTYTGRVDYNISSKQRVFARYTNLQTADISQDAIPGGVCPSSVCGSTINWKIGGGATHVRAQSAVLGDTYTFNPTTILDVRLSYLRGYNDQVPDSVGIDMSVYKGTWPALQQTISIRNDPQVNFGNDANLSTFRGNNQVSYQWNDNEVLSVGLTKIVGRHALKVGMEGRFLDRDVLQGSGSAEVSGSFDFNTNYSGRYPTHYVNSSWANFLIGAATDGTITTTRETGAYNWYQGYYVSDIWQASPKLTLTGGLRWELPGNIKEKHNRMIELLPNTIDPTTGASGTIALVASTLYPDNGSEPARHGLFAPRVGLAYRMTSHDAIRAGYAFNITAPDIETGLFPDSDSINVNNTSWSAQNNQFYTLSNPFPTSAYPNGIPQPLGRANYNTTQFLQQSIAAPVSQKLFPYMEQWNLSYSHQFRGDWLFEAAYAATVGTHLPFGHNFNQLAPSFWTNPSVPLTATCGAGTNWQWSNTTVGQCNRPLPAYQNVTDVVGNTGSLNYNSLALRGEKRFKSGGLITAAYTYSQKYGNTEGIIPQNSSTGADPQNWYNPAAERSVSSSNPPQRLVLSYVVNAPFGKGQKFLGNVNGMAGRFISGWSLNGITTYQEGLPLALTASYASGPGITPTINVPLSYGGASLRPNYTPGCTKKASGAFVSHVLANTPVLNASCWASPAASTDYTYNNTRYATSIGNEPRVDSGVRAPGQANWDIAAQKATNITERISLNFRVEFFNVFNRVQFGAPAATVPASQGFGGSTVFGIINGSSLGENNPRQGQASLRLNF